MADQSLTPAVCGPQSASGVKRCAKCCQTKPITEFSRKASAPDGHRARCRGCRSADYKIYAERNAAKIAEKGKLYREANPEKIRAWSKAQAKKPRAREYSARYRQENAERCREWTRAWWERYPHKRGEYRRKYEATPKAKVSRAIRVCIRSEIRRGSKGGRKTFALLGYTPAQLITHLEKQFLPGMAWENYGRGGWHVDHKTPLAAFHYESPDDPDFKKAWALDNLQPLWEFDNLSKGAKILAPKETACHETAR